MFFRYSIFERYKLDLFTTTTQGGVSNENYSALNLCPRSGDSISNVLENRSRLVNKLEISIENLFIPFQTHEDKVKVIDNEFLALSSEEQQQQMYGIDALITSERGICIGVTTADCVPISIYDPENHVLGVAHAGWKGTAARIGAKTVAKMMEVFSVKTDNLIVSIGPSISAKNFEVGDEVGQAFVDAGFDLNTIAFRNKTTGKLHIDLWRANIESLVVLGVQKSNIELSEICTFESAEFFSARRQTIKSGRMFTGGFLK